MDEDKISLWLYFPVDPFNKIRPDGVSLKVPRDTTMALLRSLISSQIKGRPVEDELKIIVKGQHIPLSRGGEKLLDILHEGMIETQDVHYIHVIVPSKAWQDAPTPEELASPPPNSASPTPDTRSSPTGAAPAETCAVASTSAEAAEPTNSSSPAHDLPFRRFGTFDPSASKSVLENWGPEWHAIYLNLGDMPFIFKSSLYTKIQPAKHYLALRLRSELSALGLHPEPFKVDIDHTYKYRDEEAFTKDNEDFETAISSFVESLCLSPLVSHFRAEAYTDVKKHLSSHNNPVLEEKQLFEAFSNMRKHQAYLSIIDSLDCLLAQLYLEALVDGFPPDKKDMRIYNFRSSYESHLGKPFSCQPVGDLNNMSHPHTRRFSTLDQTDRGYFDPLDGQFQLGAHVTRPRPYESHSSYRPTLGPPQQTPAQTRPNTGYNDERGHVPDHLRLPAAANANLQANANANAPADRNPNPNPQAIPQGPVVPRANAFAVVINLDELRRTMLPLMWLTFKLSFLLYIFGRHASYKKRIVLCGMALVWIVWEGVAMRTRRAAQGRRLQAAMEQQLRQQAAQDPGQRLLHIGGNNGQAGVYQGLRPGVIVQRAQRQNGAAVFAPAARAQPPQPVPFRAPHLDAPQLQRPPAADPNAPAAPANTNNRGRHHRSAWSASYWLTRIAGVGMKQECRDIGLTRVVQEVRGRPGSPAPELDWGPANEDRHVAYKWATSTIVLLVLFLGTLLPDVERRRRKVLDKREKLCLDVIERYKKKVEEEKQRAEAAPVPSTAKDVEPDKEALQALENLKLEMRDFCNTGPNPNRQHVMDHMLALQQRARQSSPRESTSAVTLEQTDADAAENHPDVNAARPDHADTAEMREAENIARALDQVDMVGSPARSEGGEGPEDLDAADTPPLPLEDVAPDEADLQNLNAPGAQEEGLAIAARRQLEAGPLPEVQDDNDAGLDELAQLNVPDQDRPDGDDVDEVMVLF